MTDVFLSCSRKDKEFVHKWYDVLVAQKRDVWEVKTGSNVRQFGVDGQISDADILPDNRLVVVTTNAAGGSSTTFLRLDFQERITYGASRVTRDLADVERSQYNIDDEEPTCPEGAPATPNAAQ